MNKLIINKKIEKYIKKLKSATKLNKINRYQKRIRVYRRFLVELGNKEETDSY
jgi:hypothetical protein